MKHELPYRTMRPRLLIALAVIAALGRLGY